MHLHLSIPRLRSLRFQFSLVLKILFPQVRLVLLDSVAKKTAFLRDLIGQLGLGGVDVVTARAEDLARQSHYREGFDVVGSRAVGGLATVTELTLPFCRIGGVFIAQKKGDIELELARAAEAICLLGGRLRETGGVCLDELTENLLVIVEKVSPTPELYPRRAGIPSKRPLR